MLGVIAPPALATSPCRRGPARVDRVGTPPGSGAWRAMLSRRTPLWNSSVAAVRRTRGSVTPDQAPWLLVLGAVTDSGGHCWLHVRLPSRPNNSAAWINADRVDLEPTPWRIVVSRSARTISLYRSGASVRRFPVVVGAPRTPSPRRLFSIVGVWHESPSDFTGSYILPLTAHSNVLQEFGGGDGRVGIHGRGGSSLLDPLGSARSHGCVRLTNQAIDWIVRTVGTDDLP